MESQDEHTKAQLSLSYEFSDQNISTMLRDYDIEGLCTATRSVTKDPILNKDTGLVPVMHARQTSGSTNRICCIAK